MPKIPKPRHTFVPWPRERFGAIDFITEARRQNTVFVFGEVDVTVPLQLIKEHEERT